MIKTAHKENIAAFKVSKPCSRFRISNTIAYSNKHTKFSSKTNCIMPSYLPVFPFDFGLFLTHREERFNAKGVQNYKLGFNKSN